MSEATVSLSSAAFEGQAPMAAIERLLARVAALEAQVEELRKPFLTRQEAAHFFGRSRSWVDQKRMAGDLEATIDGLITRASAQRLAQQLRRPAA